MLISVRGLVNLTAIVRLLELGKLKKNPMMSSGIEPMTFQLVIYVITTLKKYHTRTLTAPVCNFQVIVRYRK
jgi:hypothetical protein